MQDSMGTRCTEFMPIGWPGKDQTERICCLVCIHPVDRLGQVVELDGELLVGRDSGCELELSDDSVSRRHALLRPSASGFTVLDLGSKNGTYVNDIRVEEHVLEPSDRLRFGSQIFKYLSPDRFEAAYFENAYRMITTDGLTQAYNRRYLFDMADRELKRSRRTGRPLSLLMVDIDQFKSINDTYGHLAGDEVLIEVSRRLRSSLRADEVFARYGGDEFCVLLPDTDLASAELIAERLRAVVAETSTRTQRADVAVTVNVGAACAEASSEISRADLIEQSDKQLYAAKLARGTR